MSQLAESLNYIYTKGKNSCIILFKLMIPASIVIRVIQQLDLLPYISEWLDPVMRVVGLPAEMSLVWLTAIVVNIYGAFLALFGIYPNLAEPLTVAQITTLFTMILLAHAFPIELVVAKKTGTKLWIMFIIRFGFGILLGFVMSRTYSLLGCLQQPATIAPFLTAKTTTLTQWAINELKNYAIIACVIFALVTLIRLLEITGIIKIVNKVMGPILNWLKISDQMMPLTVVGLTLGIGYGGGLIIEESRRQAMKPKGIFYAMMLMGLFHSIFEDTILMLSMGGHWSGVIVFRLVFAIVITFCFVRVTQNIDDQQFARLFMTREFLNRNYE